MSFTAFGFRALWSPYFLFAILSIILFYFFINGKFAGKEKATIKQQLFFLAGMLLIYLCKGSPIDLLGHLMFSVHMAQMAILYLVVPPLLIIGIPNWLLRVIFNNKLIMPLMKVFSFPLVALIVFNGLFSFYHIPLLFDFVKTNTFIHAATTIILFLAALMMWWPLVNTLPEWKTLNGIKKVGYIFADGILLTPACALIIFADVPLYATYTHLTEWVTALELCVPEDMLSSLSLTGPKMFNSLPLVEDQQLGGVIMKVIQEIVYGIMLGIIFFQWAKKERDIENLEIEHGFDAQPQK